MHIILSFIVLLFCNLAFCADLPKFPFLIANGNAELKVKPDRMKLYFSVVEFSKNSKEAVSNVSKRGEEIVNLTRKNKIPIENVTSSNYEKSTKRAEGPKYQDLEILGYEVSQTFQIEVTDIIEYQSFIDQLMSLQNVSNLRAEFDVSNRKELVGELTKMAINNAKEKATELAVGFGVKVGSVFAVSQDVGFGSVEATFGVSRDYAYNAPPDFVPPPSLDFSPDSTSINIFAPKTISIEKSVSVVYKLK